MRIPRAVLWTIILVLGAYVALDFIEDPGKLENITNIETPEKLTSILPTYVTPKEASQNGSAYTGEEVTIKGTLVRSMAMRSPKYKYGLKENGYLIWTDLPGKDDLYLDDLGHRYRCKGTLKRVMTEDGEAWILECETATDLGQNN